VAARLRGGSESALLLGLQVRIPPETWMPVSWECCVLPSKSLCDGPITRPEESHRAWCVRVWSWSLGHEEALAHYGLSNHRGKWGGMKSVNPCKFRKRIYIYIFIIKPTRCSKFTNYFVMKIYMFQTVRLSIIRSLFTVHSAMVYVIQVCRQLSSRTRIQLQSILVLLDSCL
jgi:hypothetical protein